MGGERERINRCKEQTPREERKKVENQMRNRYRAESKDGKGAKMDLLGFGWLLLDRFLCAHVCEIRAILSFPIKAPLATYANIFMHS